MDREVQNVRNELVVLDMAGTTVYDGDAVHRCLAKVLNKPHALNFSVRIADENGLPQDAVVWE